jgi:hypothetical protein
MLGTVLKELELGSINCMTGVGTVKAFLLLLKIAENPGRSQGITNLKAG